MFDSAAIPRPHPRQRSQGANLPAVDGNGPSHQTYLTARPVRLDEAVPLFVNAEGNRLSRFGLRHIIAHRVAEAAKCARRSLPGK